MKGGLPGVYSWRAARARLVCPVCPSHLPDEPVGRLQSRAPAIETQQLYAHAVEEMILKHLNARLNGNDGQWLRAHLREPSGGDDAEVNSG